MDLSDKVVSTFTSKKKSKILQLIDTVGKIKKICIYDVEFQSSVARVYIDNETHSIDLNVCEDFMKTLLFLFQSEGVDDVECEVSSPGLERKLKKDWHFQAAIGKKVRICTKEPVFCYDKELGKEREKTILNGRMYKYQDNVVSVDDGALEWTVPLDIIKKANVLFDIKTQN